MCFMDLIFITISEGVGSKEKKIPSVLAENKKSFSSMEAAHSKKIKSLYV